MNNEVTNFMLYMYNKWSQSECKFLFGEHLWEHVWSKYRENGNAILYWYAGLDNKCRQKLVDRANEIYGK